MKMERMKHHDFRRLRAARVAAKLTQQSLATKSGVRQNMISQIESGRVRQPRYDTVRALADALGMTSDELAGRGRS